MKKLLRFLMAAMIPLMLSDCWYQRQFEDISLVLSTWIDAVKEGSGYEYTLAYSAVSN